MIGDASGSTRRPAPDRGFADLQGLEPHSGLGQAPFVGGEVPRVVAVDNDRQGGLGDHASRIGVDPTAPISVQHDLTVGRAHQQPTARPRGGEPRIEVVGSGQYVSTPDLIVDEHPRPARLDPAAAQAQAVRALLRYGWIQSGMRAVEWRPSLATSPQMLSGTMAMAPQGHSWAQIPQPLQ